MKALIGLLREDALQTMPPLEMWIQGASAITTWMTQPGPSACAGSILVPVRANGVRGWAQYKPDPEQGGYTPWALQVHEITDGKISRMTFFLDTEKVFPLFGLRERIFDDR
jgi:RNA polymerase sigma-70 factor (ECF subfamily)